MKGCDIYLIEGSKGQVKQVGRQRSEKTQKEDGELGTYLASRNKMAAGSQDLGMYGGAPDCWNGSKREKFHSLSPLSRRNGNVRRTRAQRKQQQHQCALVSNPLSHYGPQGRDVISVTSDSNAGVTAADPLLTTITEWQPMSVPVFTLKSGALTQPRYSVARTRWTGQSERSDELLMGQLYRPVTEK
ncbi:hypothetical protein BaRGS_00027253 [Batillaria attramentaria]|uniref:Uncharacterized protein n=1 Tax=Batillaria attramentaria TaxID=370345 RepID=A0ABD0K2H0_9CAEN